MEDLRKGSTLKARQFRVRENDEHIRLTGHMAFLKALQKSNSTVRLVTIHDDVVVGQIKNCDDMTITVRVNCPTVTNPDAYQNRVFFKQNLVELAPLVDGVTFS